MRHLYLLCFLAWSLSGCGRFAEGVTRQPYGVETTIITDLTISPPIIHTGQTVLLDYTLGKKTVYEDPRYAYDLMGRSPLLGASAGETLTLISSFYAPGDPQPTIEQAQAELEAIEGYDPALIEEGLGFQPNGHFYALFRAPDEPQVVELFFTVGASSGLTAIKETWLRTPVNVLP